MHLLRAALVSQILLLAGCSSTQDWVNRILPHNGGDTDCSPDSVPICIEIKGQTMKPEGDNYTLLDIQVGKHFNLSDFTCKCGCGEVMYTPTLVSKLDDLADHFRRDVIVTSGFRCKRHNKFVGGVKDSAHLTGQAVDFVVRGVSPAKVVQYLADWDGGLGEYTRHVHIDVGVKKRWKGSYG